MDTDQAPGGDGADRPAIEIGLVATVHLVVTAADTAQALGSGDVSVLGTPRVVALAEQATVAALAGCLGPDMTTVGTRVEIDHLAPSFVGEAVRAEARLEDITSSRLTFAVTVTDELTGRELARVVVGRVVVGRARFEKE
ncbi:MAG: thioesterase family protein [Acidimicrobiales bacterium]